PGAASPAAAAPAPPINAADPFADLIGSNAQAPVLRDPPPAPVNAADPFGDLLGSPATAPAGSNHPAEERAFPQGAIPDDFDPFAAQPSAASARNTDDPLAALASGAVDLGGFAPPPGPSL